LGILPIAMEITFQGGGQVPRLAPRGDTHGNAYFI